MVRQIQPGETIGEAQCPCCGNKLPVKVNVNRCVYVICQKVVRLDGEGKKERCVFRVSYGRDHSRKMIEEFLAKESVVRDQEVPLNVQPENRPEPAGKPEPVPEPVK